MTSRSIVALALACAVSLAACSSGPPRGRGGGAGSGFSGPVIQPVALVFIDFDADGDRWVSRDEMRAGLPGAWRGLDADASGGASVFEFDDWTRAVMGAQSPTPGRVAFDANLDGAITEAEFGAAIAAEFARLDADADGGVSRSEMIRVIELRGGRGRDAEGPQDPADGIDRDTRRP